MKVRVLVAVAALLSAQLALAADAKLGFLERRNLTVPQDKPLPMPETSKDVRDRNKQLVLDFYKVISDKRQWTDENRKKYFADDFIQHDPAEPNTSAAFFDYFRTMRLPSSAASDGAPAAEILKMPGAAAMDSNNSPVNWMVAEGDIVVVARHRNWAWKDGPTPVFNGIWVDIWRLENGKIKEQWCSARQEDANLPKILATIKEGQFPKNKNWD